MVLASNILVFGVFLFSTRMHERYLFPVAALSLLLVVMDTRYWRYAVAVHTLVFANIYLRFVWPLPASEATILPRLTMLEHPATVRVLAVLSMLLFGWLVAHATGRVSASGLPRVMASIKLARDSP